MSYSFADLASAVRGGTPISAAEVLDVRRSVWDDGGISADEAEALFELNNLVRHAAPEWTDFFVEALTQYVVQRQDPPGYVDEAKSAWLISRIDRDGRVDTGAELELLVRVFETALNAPETLKSYALRQIEQIVLAGEGPTRRGHVRPGIVDEAEVALLRRLIFAPASSGQLIVSRDEADMLWRLKDAALGADNAAEWKTLFVQAVSNHLMAYGSFKPLEIDEARRLEAFMNDRSSSVGGFLSRMGKSMAEGGFLGVFSRRSGTNHQAAEARARVITADEAAWLRQREEVDGKLDALEQALLDAIAAEGKPRDEQHLDPETIVYEYEEALRDIIEDEDL
ncbi:MAG TPA: hypothetical protein VGD10_11345 [Allosphingosinicella sp.]|uniref:hypothetical protein n=1 Tax=Allosphingosinicella sp. TaxID=2823234 RepID=UPI002ED8013B